MARTPTTTTCKKTRTQAQATGEPFIVLKSRVPAGVRGLQKRKNNRGGYVTEKELIQHLHARGRLHPTRYPGYKLYAMRRIVKKLGKEALLEKTPEGMSVPEGVGFSDEEGEAGNDSEREVAAQNSLFAIGSLTRNGVAQNRSSTRTRQKKQASSSSPPPASSAASSSASGVGTSVVGSATPVSAGDKSRKAPAPTSINTNGHHAHYGKSPALIESNYGIPPALHFSSSSESGSGSEETESSDDDVQDIALPTTSPLPSSSTPSPLPPKSSRPNRRRRSSIHLPLSEPSRPRRARAQTAKYYEVDGGFFGPDDRVVDELEAVKKERDHFAEQGRKLSAGLLELHEDYTSKKTFFSKLHHINLELSGQAWCYRDKIKTLKAELALKTEQLDAIEAASSGVKQPTVDVSDSEMENEAAAIVDAVVAELSGSQPLASTSAMALVNPPAAIGHAWSSGQVLPPSPESLDSAVDGMEGVESGGGGGQVKPPFGDESLRPEDLFFDFAEYAKLEPTVATAFVADDMGAWARGEAGGIGAEGAKSSSSSSVEQESEDLKLKLHKAELSSRLSKEELDLVSRRHQDELESVMLLHTQESLEKSELEQSVASLESDLKEERKSAQEEFGHALRLGNELAVVKTSLVDALHRAGNKDELEQIKSTAATSESRVVKLEAHLRAAANALAEKRRLASQLDEKTAECTELKRQIAEGLKKRKRAEALSKATKVLEEGRGGWGKKS